MGDAAIDRGMEDERGGLREEVVDVAVGQMVLG